MVIHEPNGAEEKGSQNITEPRFTAEEIANIKKLLREMKARIEDEKTVLQAYAETLTTTGDRSALVNIAQKLNRSAERAAVISRVLYESPATFAFASPVTRYAIMNEIVSASSSELSIQDGDILHIKLPALPSKRAGERLSTAYLSGIYSYLAVTKPDLHDYILNIFENEAGQRIIVFISHEDTKTGLNKIADIDNKEVKKLQDLILDSFGISDSSLFLTSIYKSVPDSEAFIDVYFMPEKSFWNFAVRVNFFGQIQKD